MIAIGQSDPAEPKTSPKGIVFFSWLIDGGHGPRKRNTLGGIFGKYIDEMLCTFAKIAFEWSLPPGQVRDGYGISYRFRGHV